MKDMPAFAAESADTTDSPCSSLLERLKNLRKYQDEQRRELLTNRSIGDSHESQLDEGVVRVRSKLSQVNENVTTSFGSEASHTSQLFTSSSVESQQHKYSLSNATPEHNSTPWASDLSSMNVKETNLNHSEQMENDISSVKMPQNIPPESTEISPRNTSTDYQILKNDGKISVSESLFNSKGYPVSMGEKSVSDTKRYSKIYEDKPSMKSQGLSHFINRNTTNTLSVDSNVEEHQPMADDTEVALKAKPKFAFMRKGQGTARFGMRPIKLKNCKPHESITNATKDSVKLNSPEVKFLGNENIQEFNPVTYTSKLANRPVKSLQIQRSVKNSNARSDGNPIPKIFKTSESYKQNCKEQEELSAFEKLEELADDSSFASNSSTVVRLLQKGLHSVSSTPQRSPPPSPHWTPIHANKNNGKKLHQGPIVKLTDRMGNLGIFHPESLSQEVQLPLVNVSQILEQLKEIVRLEDIDPATITEDQVKNLIESFVDPEVSLSLGSVSHFENLIKFSKENYASTPANLKSMSSPTMTQPISAPATLQDNLPHSKHRVHFRDEGVEVLEYELSEDENTLTEAPSIVDDTDLVSTSDLEILTQMSVDAVDHSGNSKFKNGSSRIQEAMNEPSTQGVQNSKRRPIPNLVSRNVPDSVASSVESSPIKNAKPSQAVQLQFSPPRQPPNSASHLIWSIFGKNKSGKDIQRKISNQNLEKKQPSKPKEKHFLESHMLKENSLPRNKVIEQDDVETYKTLLMAKVCELEKEMDTYKKENNKLKNIQKEVQREKEQLDHERKQFQRELIREKEKFQDYVDAERSKLWKERQQVLKQQQTPSISAVKEQSLEIVYLKEQLHDLQEETKKKESSHQFTLETLNEKLYSQEEELKKLKLRTKRLQRIEKENTNLKQELDIIKSNKKPLQNRPISYVRKPKMKTKTATISSINKSLDDLHNPPNAMLKGKSSSKSQPELSRVNNSEKLHDLDPVVSSFKSSEKLDDEKKMSEKARTFDDGNEDEKDSSDTKYTTDSPAEDNESQFHTTPNLFNVAEQNQSSPSLQSLNLDFTEVCRNDGIREVIYANGNKKEIHPDGSVITNFYNGDRKEVHEDRLVYIYGTDHTSHTTFTDGREVFEFPNGQKETRFPDGSSEIVFADNMHKKVLADGTELCSLHDGTVLRTKPNGLKVFEFLSGQKEVHTPEQKRREYPDGSVKIVHPDGTTETRYKTGRVRIKDKEGNILHDTHQ